MINEVQAERPMINRARMAIISATLLGHMAFFTPSLHASSPSHGAVWGYEGTNGPANWGELGYRQCSAGQSQSPVDIPSTARHSRERLEINYFSSPTRVVNNGHTVQFNYKPGSFIKVSGKRYDLVQFNFYSPSENTVSGNAYPMEIHLVHKSVDGKLAVVGVFIKVDPDAHSGSGNESLNRVFGAFAGHAGQKLRSSDKVSVADLLPNNRKHYRFMGSLTTPPCSEGVSWFVMQEPIEVSPLQLSWPGSGRSTATTPDRPRTGTQEPGMPAIG